MKNSCFWHKKPFLIFLAQVRTKWISESFSTAFLGPLCKNLLELFASGTPDRKEWVHLITIISYTILLTQCC